MLTYAVEILDRDRCNSLSPGRLPVDMNQPVTPAEIEFIGIGRRVLLF